MPVKGDKFSYSHDSQMGPNYHWYVSVLGKTSSSYYKFKNGLSGFWNTRFLKCKICGRFVNRGDSFARKRKKHICT